MDIVYVTGTIAFFVLMLLYVTACERLGLQADVHRGPAEQER